MCKPWHNSIILSSSLPFIFFPKGPMGDTAQWLLLSINIYVYRWPTSIHSYIRLSRKQIDLICLNHQQGCCNIITCQMTYHQRSTNIRSPSQLTAGQLCSDCCSTKADVSVDQQIAQLISFPAPAWSPRYTLCGSPLRRRQSPMCLLLGLWWVVLRITISILFLPYQHRVQDLWSWICPRGQIKSKS